MKVTVIPIVIRALGKVTKGLIKGLEELEVKTRVETIQTTAQLKSVLESRRLEVTYCHSNSCERLSVDTGVKTHKGVK